MNDKRLLAARVGATGLSFTSQNNISVVEDAQFNEGDISYYVVQVILTNRDLLDETTVKGSILNAKKLDVSAIENSAIV